MNLKSAVSPKHMDIEALLGKSSNVPDEEGPIGNLLDKTAEDLSITDDKGEELNSQLVKIVDGLWANKLAEREAKRKKALKYQTLANCSNVIVPKCTMKCGQIA